MEDQNVHCIVQVGFILYDRAGGGRRRRVDSFGPYFIEQYILMDLLSKSEVAQNVLDYYVHRREKLQAGVDSYSEAQGKGFICWRFISNDFSQARGSAQ